METPCVCPSEGHKYGGQKLTETSVIEPCYKKRVLIFRKLVDIKIKIKGLLRKQNPEDESFLTYLPELFGRHFIVT